MAADGSDRGAERIVTVRADHRLSVRDDSESLVVGQGQALKESGGIADRTVSCAPVAIDSCTARGTIDNAGV